MRKPVRSAALRAALSHLITKAEAAERTGREQAN
jgi:hypothetical protein